MLRALKKGCEAPPLYWAKIPVHDPGTNNTQNTTTINFNAYWTMIVIMILAPAQIGTMSCSHSCSSMRSSTCFSRRPRASWMPSPLHLSCQVWRATGPSFAPHLVSPSRSFSAWVSLVMQQSKKIHKRQQKKKHWWWGTTPKEQECGVPHLECALLGHAVHSVLVCMHWQGDHIWDKLNNKSKKQKNKSRSSHASVAAQGGTPSMPCLRWCCGASCRWCRACSLSAGIMVIPGLNRQKTHQK